MAEPVPDIRNQKIEDKLFEFGHWIPCIEAIQVGELQSNGTATLMLNRSYTVFTQAKPFDWYVFGFSANWSIDDLIDTIVQVANLAERENTSTRFQPGCEIFGTPQQASPGYMPLQMGVSEVPHIRRAWAWGTLETEEGEYGIGAWYDRRKQDFIAPIKVPQGEQLRFIVGNRCTENFEDTVIGVVGQRWQPWDQGGRL